MMTNETVSVYEAIRRVAAMLSERDNRPFADCIPDAFQWLVDHDFLPSPQIGKNLIFRKNLPVEKIRGKSGE
jgi:hypothetical protein